MTVFVQAKWAPTVLGTADYIASQTVILDKFTAYNNNTSTVNLIVHLVAAGDTPSTKNRVLNTNLLAASTDHGVPVVGHDLGPGDSIFCVAGTATSISVRISGRLR